MKTQTMSAEVRKTLRGMMIIIGVHAAAVAVIAVIVSYVFAEALDITPGPGMTLRLVLGAVCGGGLAVFMAVHMAVSLSQAVELSEKDALMKIRKTYLLRTAVVLISVTLFYYTGYVNILTMLFAIFGLKSAAYLSPVFFGEMDSAQAAAEEQ